MRNALAFQRRGSRARRTTVALAALTLLALPGGSARAQHPVPIPNWHLEFDREQEFLARCQVTFTAAPEARLREITVIGMYPPNTAVQQVTTVIDPQNRFPSKRIESKKEESGIERPYFFARFPAAPGSPEEKVLKADIEYRVKLRHRKLAPGPPRHLAPSLSAAEESYFLAASPSNDKDVPYVQGIVGHYGLQRQPGEDNLNLSARVLQVIRGLFKYQGFDTSDRKGSTCLKNGIGDCGSISTAFVTLCWAVGIPAKKQMGRYLASTPPDGKDTQLHTRPEFWCRGLGWAPVEVTGAVGNTRPVEGFYQDQGNFFTVHDETDLVLARSYGAGTTTFLSRQNPWYARVQAGGNANPEMTVFWTIVPNPDGLTTR